VGVPRRVLTRCSLPNCTLIQRKLPTHDSTKLGAELPLQWYDDVLNHILQSNVSSHHCTCSCGGNRGAHQLFCAPVTLANFTYQDTLVAAG
jgi:hypothetical protein